MNTTDTRAKLETLFKRLSDPSVSDIEAMEACLWFRKLRLDAGDVSQALGAGASNAPKQAGTTAPASALKPAPALASDGPMWPFTKKHAGESIAHIAKVDPDYLRYMLKQGLYDPLHGHVQAALTKENQPFTPTQPKAKEAK
jgi:hypothetical protein